MRSRTTPPKEPLGVLTIRTAIGPCDLRRAVQAGLQSLSRGDREKIVAESRRFATDSLSFDTVQSNSPTFDYLIGTRTRSDSVLALEVHPATAREVDRLLEKQTQTVAALREHGCSGCGIDAWVWAASGSVDLPHSSPKRKLLAEKRILGPRGRVDFRNLSEL